MSNFQLLVLALTSVTVAVWLSAKGRSAAAAPALLAAIMLLLALAGPVWEWSKYSGYAALPPEAKSTAFGESKAASAFLWASIGAGMSALLIPRVPLQTLPTRKVMPSRNMSVVVACTAAVAFVLYLAGEGPSFLRRDVYLQSDGIMFLLHVWPLGALPSVAGIALTVWEEDRRLRLFLIASALPWFIGPACTGSRTACSVPIMGGALIIYHQIRRRRLHLPLIAAALALLATGIFTFSAVNKAREMPHGLLNFPKVVQATSSEMLHSTDSVLLPVKQLVASIVVSYPDTEESVRYNVPDVLLDNANPLPGTARSPDLERFWPYEWSPLSFAGEWFGVMGWVGQVLLFGAMGWMFGLTMHNLQRSRFRLISFLPLGFVALVSVFSIEYSSRLVWRVISISVALFIASYLVRERSRYMVRETRVELPRNVIGDLAESAAHVHSTLKASRVATRIAQRYG